MDVDSVRRGVSASAWTCRETPKLTKKPSETFFEAPQALPARGSIPSVRALDPAVAAAREELANEAEHATLIHSGDVTSSPPIPAEVCPAMKSPSSSTSILISIALLLGQSHACDRTHLAPCKFPYCGT